MSTPQPRSAGRAPAGPPPDDRRAGGLRVPIAREGAPFILAPAIAGLLLVPLGGIWAGVGTVLLLAALFALYFFRDPDRRVPAGETTVVSPADGRVVHAGPPDTVEDAPEGSRWLLSIFLGLGDVHINRAPVGGVVEEVTWRPGRFRPAYRASASRVNERNEVRLRTDLGVVTLRQIAGTVARRIVFRPSRGERLERGQRIGLIRFGSRVDLFLGAEYRLGVRVGQRVRGGETVVGILAGEPRGDGTTAR